MQPWSDFLNANPTAADFLRNWYREHPKEVCIVQPEAMPSSDPKPLVWPAFPHQCLALIEELGWWCCDGHYRPTDEVITLRIWKPKNYLNSGGIFYGATRHHDALQYALRKKFADD